MSKNKLKSARKKIDQIDNKIFLQIKKRTQIVSHMMKLKRKKNEIVDYKRINEILKKIRKKSLRNKIDPKITNRIWKSMIWGYVHFQRKNFKKN